MALPSIRARGEAAGAALMVLPPDHRTTAAAMGDICAVINTKRAAPAARQDIRAARGYRRGHGRLP